jgi:hypothetical protein
MTFNFAQKKQKHENIKIYSNIYFTYGKCI